MDLLHRRTTKRALVLQQLRALSWWKWLPYSKITTILNNSYTRIYDLAKRAISSSVPNYSNCCNSGDWDSQTHNGKQHCYFQAWNCWIEFSASLLIISGPIRGSPMSTEKGSIKFCASIRADLAIMLHSSSKSTSLERTNIIKSEKKQRWAETWEAKHSWFREVNID